VGAATVTPSAGPRTRPAVMRITDAAAQRIGELMARAEGGIVGVRVGVKNGGCAGQSYSVEYAHEVRDNDEVIEDKGVRVLVDPQAVVFLLGTEMDFKADKCRRSSPSTTPIRFRPVGAVVRCSCDQRPKAEPCERSGKAPPGDAPARGSGQARAPWAAENVPPERLRCRWPGMRSCAAQADTGFPADTGIWVMSTSP